MNFSVDSDSGWGGLFYIHPNYLKTEVRKVNKSINAISNEAFDLGKKWCFENSWNSFDGKIALDYFTRQQVNSSEKATNLKNISCFFINNFS